MKLPLIQVDAFTSAVFGGNPAAIVPLPEWLSAEIMQNIAMENQLSETAFFVPEGDGFRLRWFTPNKEVDLCGHATLAAAHVLFTEHAYPGEVVVFDSRSGRLPVRRDDYRYTMDFPVDDLGSCDVPTAQVEDALGSAVRELLRGKDDILAVLDSAEAVAGLTPDIRKIAEIEARGILVTAAGETCDFVSRCFFPRFGIDEDPVTGSAHTTMTPYWAEKLEKTELTAKQISPRGGDLECVLSGHRVFLSGQAVTYLRGEILLDDIA